MKYLIVSLLLFPPLISNGQLFDLLITQNGDSIACNIDSVTHDQVYFEMKMKGQWIHTNILKDSVTISGKIDRQNYGFIGNTSYVSSEVREKVLGRSNVHVGFGSPDLLHIGFGYDILTNVVLDLNAGYFPICIFGCSDVFTISLDSKWHFGKTLDNRKRFYARTGFTLISDSGDQTPWIPVGLGVNFMTKQKRSGWSFDLSPLMFDLSDGPLFWGGIRFQYYVYFKKDP